MDRAERGAFAVALRRTERAQTASAKWPRSCVPASRRVWLATHTAWPWRDTSSVSDSLSVTRSAASRGNHQFRLQAAFVVDRQEADDRGLGPLSQQVERRFPTTRFGSPQPSSLMQSW